MVNGNAEPTSEKGKEGKQEASEEKIQLHLQMVEERNEGEVEGER